MKKIMTLAAAALCTLPMLADINTMNYQAVISQPDGQAAAEKNIGLKFSIIKGDVERFVEETQVTSDAAGMVEWQVGSKSPDGLAGIDWAEEGLQLQVAVDLNGGTDYSSVYTSSIQSVPSAIYSLKSADTDELRLQMDELWKESNVNYASMKGQVVMLENRTEEISNRTDENFAINRASIENLNGYMSDVLTRMEDMRVEVLNNKHSISILETGVNNSDSMIQDLYNRLDNMEQRVYDIMSMLQMLENRVTELERK